MNLSALTSAKDQMRTTTLPWNQSSDRQEAGVQKVVHPTRGNSQRSTLTSLKPGACSPGGVGVDIKHNAYARYLNKKKAANLKAQAAPPAAQPLYGNKTFSVNCVENSNSCCK
jgi:hypothetical protein